MTQYLLDTNVAVRSVVRADPQFILVQSAVLKLLSNGDSLVVSAQVLTEAWAVLTRPAEARGGYGFSTSESATVIYDIMDLASLAPDPIDLWDVQYKLLIENSVSGVQTYDCRIAAWCLLKGVDAIFTLNSKDFARYGMPSVTPETIL